MNLTKILSPESVIVPLKGKNKEAAIVELIDLLDWNKLLTDRDEALEAVMMREKTHSTGIGSGIAIPHGKCKGLNELVMAIGLAEMPIDFESLDGKPVKTIILLVSPLGQNGPHIQALAQISRLMLDNEFKQAFEQAESAKALYGLLLEKEGK